MLQVVPNPNYANGSSYSPYTVGGVRSWITVITVICAGVMSMGYVDALQNGFAGTISAYFFRDKSVWYARGAVLVINAILMSVAAAKGSKINALLLFGITNLLCTCCAFPLCLGMFERKRKWLNGDMVVFSSLGSVFLTSVFGTRYMWYRWDIIVSVCAFSRPVQVFPLTGCCDHALQDTSTTLVPGSMINCYANGYCTSYQRFQNGMVWTWYGNGYGEPCSIL